MNAISLVGWTIKFPDLLSVKGTWEHGNNDFLKQLEVYHKEIDRKINVVDIPVTPTSLTYNIREVTQKEVEAMVKMLETEGVITPYRLRKRFF